jgi:tetratricopeptide (TPR) repeat protein
MYYQNVTGELEQASQVYELWAKSYPLDIVPHGNLGEIHRYLGQYDKAAAEMEEGQRLERSVIGYLNLAQYYLYLNRVDDATKTVEEAQAKKFDGDFLHLVILFGDFE